DRRSPGTGRPAVGGQHHRLPAGLPPAGADRPPRGLRPDRSDAARQHQRGQLRRLLERLLRRPAERHPGRGRAEHGHRRHGARLRQRHQRDRPARVHVHRRRRWPADPGQRLRRL
ncbi:MAG: Putative serine/threonine protein kinase, partial [uncultured Nocardioides sp.]